MTALAAVHAASTWFMVGLIWTIQVVHYPLFHAVGTRSFRRYEEEHTRRIGKLLLIPAAVEVTTAGWLALADPAPDTLIAGAVLVGIWVLTAVVYGPLHGRLAPGYDERLVTRLITVNWWRTAAWTLRGGLALAILLAP